MQEREFEELLWKARNKDKKAVFEIIEMYRPLLLKYAKSNGKFDEDLYQELVCAVLKYAPTNNSNSWLLYQRI